MSSGSVALIDCLARTGVKRLEVTSFVRADVIPQLADAPEVLTRIDPPEDVSLSVLIPNEKGLDKALEHRERFHEVNCFLSASETHTRKNVNRSVEESLSGLERVLGRARGEGLHCEGIISVSFGCPYEGEVPVSRVVEIVQRAVRDGADSLSFGDTTGMATPTRVTQLVGEVRSAVPDTGLNLHFHNTRGTGLANVLAALQLGVTDFDAALRDRFSLEQQVEGRARGQLRQGHVRVQEFDVRR